METTHDDDAPQPRVWRLGEFMRLVQSGLFDDDEDLELLDGAIVVKRPESPRHRAVMGIVQRELERVFGSQFWVRLDAPLIVDDTSMPDPDLAVVRGAPQEHMASHPQRAELVVEVSDSSRSYDLGKKQEMYSRSGQPEYWCIDLVKGLLWVHRTPGPKGYKSITRFEAGESVTPLGASAAVEVVKLFPGT